VRLIVSCSKHSSPVLWKLIVAAEAPWAGEIYHTRPGNHRVRFDSVESFCGAVLEVTGWSLDLPAAASDRRQARPARKSRSHLFRETHTAARKFIIAADAPWSGEMYRTQPGLGHIHFTSFETMLRTVLDVTGWPLESRTTPDRDLASAGQGGASAR
jgi:hypothetical protein